MKNTIEWEKKQQDKKTIERNIKRNKINTEKKHMELADQVTYVVCIIIKIIRMKIWQHRILEICLFTFFHKIVILLEKSFCSFTFESCNLCKVLKWTKRCPDLRPR